MVHIIVSITDVQTVAGQRSVSVLIALYLNAAEYQAEPAAAVLGHSFIT